MPAPSTSPSVPTRPTSQTLERCPFAANAPAIGITTSVPTGMPRLPARHHDEEAAVAGVIDERGRELDEMFHAIPLPAGPAERCARGASVSAAALPTLGADRVEQGRPARPRRRRTACSASATIARTRGVTRIPSHSRSSPGSERAAAARRAAQRPSANAASSRLSMAWSCSSSRASKHVLDANVVVVVVPALLLGGA